MLFGKVACIKPEDVSGLTGGGGGGGGWAV